METVVQEKEIKTEEVPETQKEQVLDSKASETVSEKTSEPKHGKKKSILKLIFVILIAAIFAGIVAIAVAWPRFSISGFEDEIILNAGDEYVNEAKVCFGNIFGCENIEPEVDGSVNTSVLGEYEVKYTYSKDGQIIEKTQKVVVRDGVGPVLNVEGEVVACPNGKILKAKVSAIDNLDGDISGKVESELKNSKITFKSMDSSGNISKLETNATVRDTTGPKITLNGSGSLTIFTGGKYSESGASANDDCDGEVKVTTSGGVNTNKAGTYKITYTASDNAGNKSTATRTVYVREKGKRIVYLTFDDGPGDSTGRLLDILKKYNVKATFFVTCRGSDNLIKRAYDEGHTIGLHTCSHDYADVYASDARYFNDLRKISDRVKRITGIESKIIRFPGGSSNTVSAKYNRGIMTRLTKEVQKRGYKYFDWNVSSGDAGGANNANAVYNNVVRGLKEDTSVVLQHDIKKFSVDAVERIIKYGLANGYTFLPLSENSFGAHHRANN